MGVCILLNRADGRLADGSMMVMQGELQSMTVEADSLGQTQDFWKVRGHVGAGLISA